MFTIDDLSLDNVKSMLEHLDAYEHIAAGGNSAKFAQTVNSILLKNFRLFTSALVKLFDFGKGSTDEDIASYHKTLNNYWDGLGEIFKEKMADFHAACPEFDVEYDATWGAGGEMENLQDTWDEQGRIENETYKSLSGYREFVRDVRADKRSTTSTVTNQDRAKMRYRSDRELMDKFQTADTEVLYDCAPELGDEEYRAWVESGIARDQRTNDDSVLSNEFGDPTHQPKTNSVQIIDLRK